MSEPVKHPGQQPESYQPRKPEMMKALEEVQGQAERNGASQAAVSSGGSGGKMIPNVPPIKYDGNNAGMYTTLLSAALQSIGEECDGAKLTALSGAGNRFCWSGKWTCGHELPESINDTPYETESRVLNAIGWKAKFATVERDKEGNYVNTNLAQIRRDFIDSIDKGFPVIAQYSGHGHALSNIFFGYEDDGRKIISYPYASRLNVQLEGFEPGVSEPLDPETPVAEDNWEDTITEYILLQEKEDTVSERNTALAVFQWISRHARKTTRTKIYGNLVGFAAWELFLTHLEHDDFSELSFDQAKIRFDEYCNDLCQIWERKAALPYYRSLSEQFPEWREELDAAVAALDACASYVEYPWKHGFSSKKAGIKKFKTAKGRKKLAEAGREAMKKDMEAVEQFEKIVKKEEQI